MRRAVPCTTLVAWIFVFVVSAATPAQSQMDVATDKNATEEPEKLDPTKANIPVKRTYRAAAGALIWLARQQHLDGSWDFRDGEDRNKLKNIHTGQWRSRTGATGLVLIPFLAAGQTHKSRGPYQQTVASGLQFLIRWADEHATTGKGPATAADLCGEGGDLTWHAAATVALCEAYGLTGDAEVGKRAQQAIDFIAARQDRNSGGWAARPGRQPAMSATAWQMVALKSGHLAGMKVDSAFFDAAGGEGPNLRYHADITAGSKWRRAGAWPTCRYSLDKPGLILASQGETVQDYLRKVSHRSEPLDPFVLAGAPPEAGQLHGRPLIYCPQCCDVDRASYVTHHMSLSQFSVATALQREWCEPNTMPYLLGLGRLFWSARSHAP